MTKALPELAISGTLAAYPEQTTERNPRQGRSHVSRRVFPGWVWDKLVSRPTVLPISLYCQGVSMALCPFPKDMFNLWQGAVFDSSVVYICMGLVELRCAALLMPHHSLNGLLSSSSGSLLLLNGEKNGHILITKPYFLRGSSFHKDTVYEIL